MTTKKPRICEHEEEYIANAIHQCMYFNPDDTPKKCINRIIRRLKKPCAKCSKKKI